MGSLLASRIVFPLVCLILLTCIDTSQDLGSSNKLFGGGKKTTAPRSTKKTPVKRKPVASKPRTPIKKPSATIQKRKPVVHPATAKRTPQKRNTETSRPTVTPTTEPIVGGLPPGRATDELFDRLIREGNAARDERSYLAAETAYQRARAVKPRDQRAPLGLGSLYVDQQRWDDAESAYRTALQLGPNSAIVHIALSYVLIQPITAPNLSDRYEEAEKLARRAIELSPTNALAFDQLGVALELRGWISAETENAYRKAIRLDPSFAPAYAHLGRLLRRRGVDHESADEYENAVRLATDAPTMVIVADVMQSEQRYSDSEDLLRKALAADPRNPGALMLLGRALTVTGKYAEAESSLRQCVEISPNAFMPNSLLGSLFARQGKFELAENSLLQALRFVSPNERPMLSRQFELVGDGYMKAGRRINAERAYRQALDLDPENKSLESKAPARQH